MKWNSYRIKTTTLAEEMISYTLGELGIEGVLIEDNVPLSQEDKEKLFIDILPALPPDEGIAYISFYIEPEKDSPEFISDIIMRLKALSDYVDVGELSWERSITADEDWINNWKSFWKPFEAEEGIIIKPSWEELETVPDGSTVVELDPGTAFGTGMHHTTKLCITQLKKRLQRGQSVLDVGCGSGILSITAMLLGAGEAVATDVDPIAVKYTQENAIKNNLNMDRFTCMSGDIIEDEKLRESCGKHDIVVANILADVIIPLSSVVSGCMKSDGLFISSGIISDKENDVQQALLSNGFEIVEIGRSGDWVAFCAKLAN